MKNSKAEKFAQLSKINSNPRTILGDFKKMKAQNSNTLEDKKDRFTKHDLTELSVEVEYGITFIVTEKRMVAKMCSDTENGVSRISLVQKANAEHIVKCVNAFPELVAALQKIADCENSAFRLDRRDALGFIKIAKEALTKVKS